MKRRTLILSLAFLATLAAVAWTAYQESETSALVEPVEPRQYSRRQTASEAHQTPPHTVLNQANRDAFAPRDWTPPPPPPPKALPPPPPPPPMAPPLPYRYVGKMLEDGHLMIFLDARGRTITVKGGEVLDGQWRVDGVEPRLIRFTFLPLAQTATLNIGDAL